MKYKIEQEDFDRLNQLDRIEYRQIHNQIEEDYPFEFIKMLYVTGIIFLFVGAFVILVSLIKPEVAPLMKDVLRKLPVIFLIPLLILFVDITTIFIKNRKVRDLNDKYFKASISPKNKKGGRLAR